MRRQRNAKIVATFGPASSDKTMIKKKLFEADADVFRLNFSNGNPAEQKARLDAIREVEREKGRPIGAMADLQGSKFRVGQFKEEPVELH